MASSDSLMSSETWAFRSTLENSWISEAFTRDNEVLTRALQMSIFSGVSSPTVDASPYSELANVVKPETPSSHHQGQSVSTSGGGSETDTVSKRSAQYPGVPPKGKIGKRRSRASKRSPTTFIAADPENFRQMVQEVTGVRFASGQIPVGSVVKPEPQRAVGMANRLQPGCLLPTLDTSAFLLDHHQQVVAPAAAQGSGSTGVVAEGGGTGLDFDGFSCFPTLESWKVM
uniref:VQ domain-containing protein n=1 Tax=Opuntia streptacantha TaxID=393608 RepID=A0A7C9F875_OPUST